MYIKRIQVKNFKSFTDLDLQLNDLNIFIGANASGKSNFVSIAKFLRNIARHGLENAISMEGGVEYLRNTTLGASQNLEVSIDYVLPVSDVIDILNDQKIITEVEYRFSISFYKRRDEFRIVEDILTLYYQSPGQENGQPIEIGTVSLKVNRNRHIKVKIQSTEKLPSHLPLALHLNGTPIMPHTLLLETPFFQMVNNLDTPFSSLGIYDLDPKLSKQATSITGFKELEEDGSNLSIVLKNIARNSEQKRKLLNLLQDLLPFISDFNTQQSADKSVLFRVREAYSSSKTYLPASLISDGTASIVALLVALYFEQKTPIILEEPERNIYPHLISNLVNMFEDASANKQLIITTHNPEVVRYASLDDLFMVARDEDGFSTVQKPAEIEAVKIVLQNEIGIEELYVQNLLGLPQ